MARTTKKVTPTTTETTTSPSCENCVFHHKVSRGPILVQVCQRYPTPIPIQYNWYWCGEYKQR
jgi:hypothetical protein